MYKIFNIDFQDIDESLEEQGYSNFMSGEQYLSVFLSKFLYPLLQDYIREENITRDDLVDEETGEIDDEKLYDVIEHFSRLLANEFADYNGYICQHIPDAGDIYHKLTIPKTFYDIESFFNSYFDIKN